MQCPPTNPGLKFKKFHLVPAASSTSFVLISILLNTMDNSFMKAILISRCAFSITFAASATLMLGARCIPASIISLYTENIVSSASSSEPDTTFTIFVNVLTLSPGFILSGEYPTLKSSPNFNPEVSSITGIQISSVVPGLTVDSNTMMAPFVKFLATVLLASIIGVKFGVLSEFIGVGTATI